MKKRAIHCPHCQRHSDRIKEIGEENSILRNIIKRDDVGREALLWGISENKAIYEAAVDGLKSVNQVLLDRINVLEKKPGNKKGR